MKGRCSGKKVWSCILTAAMLISTVSSAHPVQSYAQTAVEEKEDAVNEAMKLWYTTPANINTQENNGGEWMQQSLPLGNGNLGNLIFGGVAKERIHFNEKTLWTGGPSDSRPNYQFGNKSTSYTAEEIEAYRQILDDKSEKVFPDSMSGYGYVPIRFPGADTSYKGSYQDFGDIWLDFSAMGMTDELVTDYRRELDLQTGIASTAFVYQGVEYRREHFVSSPDKVMVTRVSASDKGKMDVTIKMELNNGNLSGTTTLNPVENSCTIDGIVADNGLKFRTTMKIIPSGGTITANQDAKTYTVSDADSFLILMAAETDYKNDYPTYRDTEKNLTAVVDGRINGAAEKTYDKLKEAHLTDHQALFDRVSLDLGEVNTELPTDQLVQNYRDGVYSRYLEVLSFQFGRYLTIAGSRGTLPSNLVGLWTVGPSAWTGDYHFNVNVQMNYWPVYVTNLAECGTTMVEYMDHLREPGRLTAERVHGIEGAVENHTGFVVHTENNPFGMTAPSNMQEYGWNPTGAAWAIQNLWAHYEFTQDEAYLEETIYPIMKEAALFWDQYLWTSSYQVINDETSPYDGQARLVVAPSFSEEQGPTAVATTYDQSLVWELYNECIKAGTILGEDSELLEKWTENMQKLDPIEINATNGIKEWYEETRVGTESGHHHSYAKAGSLEEIAVPNSGWNIGHPGEQRHASHLVGLYPGTLINKENETYMNAAIQSLTERGEYSTGWSKANKINLWARTGNGEKAYTLLNHLIGGNSAGLQYNLFDSHGSGGGETMKNGSPVWQIDGNYGLTSGVAEMLLQSQLGYIQLLPALPEAWADGSVKGLVARGNFEIAMDWTEESLTEAAILSNNGGVCTIEYPTITKATVLDEKGNKVPVTIVNDTQISFATEKGTVYTITKLPKRPLGARKFDQEILAANAVANSEQWPAGYVNDGKAAWAFDNQDHWWHSRYENWDQKREDEIGSVYGDGKPTESNPIWIQTGFDTTFYIDHIDYTSRSSSVGMIKDYTVSVANLADPKASAKEEDFRVIKSGTLDDNTETQTIWLDEITAATHVRITVTSVNCTRDQHVNAKKIDIYGYKEDPQVRLEVIRVAGKDRYATSIKIAEELKAVLGTEKFETAIIATGKMYADPLSGSYLAASKQAPILLTDGETAVNERVVNYINENVAENAQIYILGGESAVPKVLETMLEAQGYTINRLGGSTRYETCRKILDEAGYAGETELLIATGKNFPDSLSASAVGKPIMLINPESGLNADQKKVLAHFKTGVIYILGGDGVITAKNEQQIKSCVGNAKVKRLGGQDRYATSVEIAKQFFADSEKAVVAYGKEFPDGLCGGVLAAAMNAPILLTIGGESQAAEYASSKDIRSGYVLGGVIRVSDDSAKKIFAADEIIESK